MPTWPLSRIQSFLANSVPVISAAFLNGVQDVVVALFNGVISVKSLVADATGANVVAPTAGDIAASRSLRAGRAAAAGTAPTGAVEAGELTKGLVLVGWAVLNGPFTRGINVYAVAHPSTGVYEITFDRVLVNSTNVCAVANIFNSGVPGHVFTNSDAGGVGGRVRVIVEIQDNATPPARMDAPFCALLMGE